MANVLNPEPESITLNTELETPTLEPATELEQPSSESTSNPETAEVVEAVELRAGRRCPNRACSRGRACWPKLPPREGRGTRCSPSPLQAYRAGSPG